MRGIWQIAAMTVPALLCGPATAQVSLRPFELPAAYAAGQAEPTGIVVNGRVADSVTAHSGDRSVAGAELILRYDVTRSDGGMESYYAAGSSILVKVGRGGGEAAAVARALGGGIEPLGIADLYRLDIAQPSAQGVEDAIAAAEALPGVLYAEPNWIQYALKKRPSPSVRDARRGMRARVPNDTNIREQWYLNNTGQTGGRPDADIDAFEAWDSQTGSRDVVVAVVDTGIDYRHPDLAANIWNNARETGTDAQGRDRRSNGVDDDGNGFVDDWIGWDFSGNDNDPLDVNGHGTHVAGTIAAVGNNGRGIAGVAWNARLMPLQFLNAAGSGSTDAAIRAIAYATANQATFSNNSWGGGAYSQALFDTIQASGQLFVASAGNDGRDNDATPKYPASYASDLVIAVAASDHNDTIAPFSNYGRVGVDIAAPGVDILSTWPNGNYARLDGTSMAAPVVSGALALLKAHNPAMGAAQMKARLLAKGDPVAALAGKVATGARANAANGLVVTYSAEIPIGAIMPFYGRLHDVPDNWMICDGSQVLDPLSPLAGQFIPDLRGRFVGGASAAQPEGSRGGQAVAPHHGHQLAVQSSTVHFDLRSGNGYASSYNPASRAHAFDRNRVALGAPSAATLPTPNNPYESHGHMNGRAFVGGYTEPAGAHDNRPPYVALHYLIRVR